MTEEILGNFAGGHTASLVCDFYVGEDFSKRKDEIIPIPDALYDFVSTVTSDNICEMTLRQLSARGVLVEVYDTLIDTVIDLEEKTWGSKFNDGTLQVAYGDNILYVNIQPFEVCGIAVFKEPSHSHSLGLIKDMGLYNITVRFYILKDEEPDMYEDMDEAKEEAKANDRLFDES